MSYRRYVVAVAALTILAACGDSTGPSEDESGRVTFTYTGGGNGTFNVSGIPPKNSTEAFSRNWAAGVWESGSVSVFANRARTGQRYDLVVFNIPRQTAGTVAFDPACSETEDFCPLFFFFINSSENDGNIDFVCALETGSLTIAEISSDRMRGSFQGGGTCFAEATGESAFAISGGTFDVPFEAVEP